MSKKSETLIAVHRRDNLNKLAAFLTDKAPEGARIVVPTLAAGRIEWPQSAAAALQIENLAEPVLAVLADIGWQITQGDAVPPAWLRRLRELVRRYHNVKV